MWGRPVARAGSTLRVDLGGFLEGARPDNPLARLDDYNRGRMEKAKAIL
jgi:hypothetical protein